MYNTVAMLYMMLALIQDFLLILPSDILTSVAGIRTFADMFKFRNRIRQVK
jgi:hypothetical protein